ncbi:hypothetical protein FISHEDRAFT_62434 [Fistulina hepatica ATCC 64428]|nr:hypothetical protein FISHEDRAFT_62434 [Fistulina hepatica ATCC 64428]
MDLFPRDVQTAIPLVISLWCHLFSVSLLQQSAMFTVTLSDIKDVVARRTQISRQVDHIPQCRSLTPKELYVLTMLAINVSPYHVPPWLDLFCLRFGLNRTQVDNKFLQFRNERNRSSIRPVYTQERDIVPICTSELVLHLGGQPLSDQVISRFLNFWDTALVKRMSHY